MRAASERVTVSAIVRVVSVGQALSTNDSIKRNGGGGRAFADRRHDLEAWQSVNVDLMDFESKHRRTDRQQSEQFSEERFDSLVLPFKNDRYSFRGIGHTSRQRVLVRQSCRERTDA